jgi:DNA-binding CsgD family transcriptional regulator
MGFVTRFTLLGAVLGVLVGSAVLWLIDTRVTDVLLKQAAARATDQVRLAVLTRVTVDDFAPPHTPAKFESLSARLAPVLGGVQHDGSGIAGVSLVAPDGTVMYSDVSHRRGQKVASSDLSLLSNALEGAVASDFDGLLDEEDADLHFLYESALEVYVPVVLDGHVVGAYEVYQDIEPFRSARPLVVATVAAVFGLLFHLGIRAAAASARPPRALHRRRVPCAAVLPPRVSLSARGNRKGLTQRELEVLKMMATSHTYREIASGLGVSEETVRSHVKRILHKLGQRDRTQAVVAALEAGILRLS